MSKRASSLLTGSCLAAGLLCGCVTSRSTEYRRQMSATVSAESGPSDEIADAFDLEPKPPVAVTAVRDR